jgi:hypothetical protein
MNAPSRTMPPSQAPQKATIATWLVLAGLFAFLAWGVAESQPLRWIMIGTFALLAVLTIVHHIWLKRIREERKKESICTFARALPAKSHDTWVVRAVYQEIAEQAGAPIRPMDEVAKFWGIHGEDLDDVAVRIADRAGRSMDQAEKNPMRGRVVTIADMISFIEHQPRKPIQLITDNSGASPLRV